MDGCLWGGTAPNLSFLLLAVSFLKDFKNCRDFFKILLTLALIGLSRIGYNCCVEFCHVVHRAVHSVGFNFLLGEKSMNYPYIPSFIIQIVCVFEMIPKCVRCIALHFLKCKLHHTTVTCIVWILLNDPIAFFPGFVAVGPSGSSDWTVADEFQKERQDLQWYCLGCWRNRWIRPRIVRLELSLFDCGLFLLCWFHDRSNHRCVWRIVGCRRCCIFRRCRNYAKKNVGRRQKECRPTQ